MNSHFSVTGDPGRSTLRVGWPGGISPPGSHRSVRDSLPSHGSYHPGHQNEWTHRHCAKNSGSRCVTAFHQARAFLKVLSRLYFFRAQRTR
jgi:hypothetical protein